MDRFSAYLLLRQTLRIPANRRLAQLAEIVAEKIAIDVDQPADQTDLWAMMALLVHLDFEYATAHADVRGRVAREQAELEGLAPDLAKSLENCWEVTGESPAIEHGIQLAAWLAAHSEVSDLEHELELRRSQGDSLGDRLDDALTGLSLSAARAAELAKSAHSELQGARP